MSEQKATIEKKKYLLRMLFQAQEAVDKREFSRSKVGAVLFQETFTTNKTALSVGVSNRLHAPVKALLQFFEDYSYSRYLKGFSMLVTHGPCAPCLTLMHYVGITKVYYLYDSPTNYKRWGRLLDVYQLALDGTPIIRSAR